MQNKRYRLLISYDGTAYAGWQVQPNGISVQQVLEQSIKKGLGETVKLHGSGRTDQGVHAAGQVAHFDSSTKIPASKVAMVLNSILPADIRVLRSARVAPGFHSRKSAKSKEYRYFICNKPLLDPFMRLYRSHIRRPLDVRAMRQAARWLRGTHDFSSFCANPRQNIHSHVRTIISLVITEKDGDICIKIRGDGFLYKMVRSIAGYLVRVGAGEVHPKSIKAVLDSKKRTAAVPTAPAAGLFLWKVTY